MYTIAFTYVFSYTTTPLFRLQVSSMRPHVCQLSSIVPFCFFDAHLFGMTCYDGWADEICHFVVVSTSFIISIIFATHLIFLLVARFLFLRQFSIFSHLFLLYLNLFIFSFYFIVFFWRFIFVYIFFHVFIHICFLFKYFFKYFIFQVYLLIFDVIRNVCGWSLFSDDRKSIAINVTLHSLSYYLNAHLRVALHAMQACVFVLGY